MNNAELLTLSDEQYDDALKKGLIRRKVIIDRLGNPHFIIDSGVNDPMHAEIGVSGGMEEIAEDPNGVAMSMKKYRAMKDDYKKGRAAIADFKRELQRGGKR